jgi:hypothetical protein
MNYENDRELEKSPVSFFICFYCCADSLIPSILLTNQSMTQLLVVYLIRFRPNWLSGIEEVFTSQIIEYI